MTGNHAFSEIGLRKHAFYTKTRTVCAIKDLPVQYLETLRYEVIFEDIILTCLGDEGINE